MPKETLLDKAMAIPKTNRHTSKITKEHMELAIAWLKDSISLTQIAKVTGNKSLNSTTNRIALWLREAYRNDMIKVSK